MITHKSDIWSGCVTMMNVLIGKGANVDSQTQVHVSCVAVPTNVIFFVYRSVTF